MSAGVGGNCVCLMISVKVGAPGRFVNSYSVALKAPVDTTFRLFAPEQGLLLTTSLDDWLPAEHLARFVADLVHEHLDLSRIHAADTETRGGPHMTRG